MPSSSPPIGIINTIVGGLNTVAGIIWPVGQVVTWRVLAISHLDIQSESLILKAYFTWLF
jgi:hypothetical protein